MFDKIYDFYCDFEDLFKLLFILFFFFFIVVYFLSVCDKELTKEKNIIEHTQDYVTFTDCKKINDFWYCWNRG